MDRVRAAMLTAVAANAGHQSALVALGPLAMERLDLGAGGLGALVGVGLIATLLCGPLWARAGETALRRSILGALLGSLAVAVAVATSMTGAALLAFLGRAIHGASAPAALWMAQAERSAEGAKGLASVGVMAALGRLAGALIAMAAPLLSAFASAPVHAAALWLQRGAPAPRLRRPPHWRGLARWLAAPALTQCASGLLHLSAAGLLAARNDGAAASSAVAMLLLAGMLGALSAQALASRLDWPVAKLLRVGRLIAVCGFAPFAFAAPLAPLAAGAAAFGAGAALVMLTALALGFRAGAAGDALPYANYCAQIGGMAVGALLVGPFHALDPAAPFVAGGALMALTGLFSGRHAS